MMSMRARTSSLSLQAKASWPSGESRSGTTSTAKSLKSSAPTPSRQGIRGRRYYRRELTVPLVECMLKSGRVQGSRIGTCCEASASMLVLAKEMLSQREAEPSIARPGEPPPPPPPLKNIQLVTSLAHHHARLLVVDESHNLNKRNVTKQELNLYAEPIRGIPKLLLTGTPGTTAGEVFRLLQIVRHKSLLQTTKKKTLSRAGAAAAAAGVQLAATIMEDRVKFDHVSDSFLGNRDQRLREWRIKVQNVRAVTEVAGLMRELREGMLDQLMGQVLFKAGWTTDGDRYKVWYSAAQAPNLSAERLLKLLGELKASRSAEDMPALPHLLPSLAAGSSSEVVRPSRSAASCSAGSSAPIAGTCSSAPAPTAEPPPKRQKHAEDGMPSMADIMAHLRREFPGAPRDASDLLAYLSSEFTSPPDGLGNIKSKLFYFYEQTK